MADNDLDRHNFILSKVISTVESKHQGEFILSATLQTMQQNNSHANIPREPAYWRSLEESLSLHFDWMDCLPSHCRPPDYIMPVRLRLIILCLIYRRGGDIWVNVVAWMSWGLMEKVRQGGRSEGDNTKQEYLEHLIPSKYPMKLRWIALFPRLIYWLCAVKSEHWRLSSPPNTTTRHHLHGRSLFRGVVRGNQKPPIFPHDHRDFKGIGSLQKDESIITHIILPILLISDPISYVYQ